ncbi:hypothetical protein MPNT_290002 [Candidatus Methylacidithermus pantelleriae]|uniref:Uncharacterized protein n=1 Tax=Candidatus Methylacidithermus pantelleriae TaxID=2744239 RepID=A0A8J2FSG5_9BACT|nr:hypothetical protein MPNT_290002 [Candidatus Methylacidithermus pantelleriae]
MVYEHSFTVVRWRLFFDRLCVVTYCEDAVLVLMPGRSMERIAPTASKRYRSSATGGYITPGYWPIATCKL